MITLRISLPKRPWISNNPQRKVYRVVLDSGAEISIKELATRLGVAYNTLFEEITYGSQLSVGTHTTKFHEAMARAKRKNRVFAKTVKCQHCNGRGRIARPNPLPPSPPAIGTATNPAE